MKTNRQRNLWCQTPKEREANNKAISSLNLLTVTKFSPDESQVFLFGFAHPYEFSKLLIIYSLFEFSISLCKHFLETKIFR